MTDFLRSSLEVYFIENKSDADRIAVVDGMHIIEQGSREELLALGGAYAKLEKAQELA